MKSTTISSPWTTEFDVSSSLCCTLMLFPSACILRSAGAFAIATIYHSAVGYTSGGTEGVAGERGGGGEGGGGSHTYATGGGRFERGGSADDEYPINRGGGGSYGHGGGWAAGGGGGYGGCAFGGAGKGWGEGTWIGGEGSRDGYGRISGGEAEWGVVGQGRHRCRAETRDEAWDVTSWGTVNRQGEDAVPEDSAEAGAGAGVGYGNLPRDSHDVIGHHQQLVLAEDAISGNGVVERVDAPTDEQEVLTGDSFARV